MSEIPSRWAAVASIAEKIGCVPQTLHERVKKAEVDSGRATGSCVRVLSNSPDSGSSAGNSLDDPPERSPSCSHQSSSTVNKGERREPAWRANQSGKTPSHWSDNTRPRHRADLTATDIRSRSLITNPRATARAYRGLPHGDGGRKSATARSTSPPCGTRGGHRLHDQGRSIIFSSAQSE